MSTTIDVMKKIIIATSLIIVVAIAGFTLWYAVFKPDNLNVSTGNITPENTENIEEQQNPNGNWRVSPQQDVFVGYEIAELFGGESVKVTAIARTKSVTGGFTITDGELTETSIVVDLTLLSSDSSSRDNKMRTEGLETDKFPEATFTQNAPVKIAKNINKNEEIQVSIPGVLNLHGVSREITVDLDALWDGKVITVSGEIDIVLDDYNIEAPDSSFVTVDNEGKIKLQLLFVPNN